ncbi:MAG: poly(A) polymerase, partial [Pseudomonadota bacterium]
MSAKNLGLNPTVFTSSGGYEIVEHLQKKGFEAYFVGGCIRDSLTNQIPKDFDIATSARPEQINALFSQCRLIGRRFRLAHVR